MGAISPMKVSVITPVWNRSDLTGQYMFSHDIHYLAETEIEWIIIDNGSTDGTQKIIEYWQGIIGQDKVTMLRNDTNLGFSIACNQGALAAKGDILIFLNNDVQVVGDYISIIEKAIASNRHSLVGGQLIEFDTGWNVFSGQIIPYLVGWCLAMTRDAFHGLGSFDERYSPADYEDMDLCYNANIMGYDLQGLTLPLKHWENQTGKHLPDRRKITEANRIKFSKKWGLSYETK